MNDPLAEMTIEEGRSGKLFDNYGPVNFREAIGTFFLGLLAVGLLIAFLRSQSQYVELLKQTRLDQ